MTLLEFTHEYQYGSTEHNVYVPLRLLDARTPTVIRAMLDTGAAVSTLNRRYASHLRIDDIASGHDLSFLTATGERVRAYIHRVGVEFLGHQMTIDVAFAPDVEMADLLGMRGFFDQMRIAFDHANRKVHVAFA